MAAKRDFTDRFLKAIKPAPAGKRIILHDAQIPGFGIRVSDKSTDDDKGSFVLVPKGDCQKLAGGSPKAS